MRNSVEHIADETKYEINIQQAVFAHGDNIVEDEEESDSIFDLYHPKNIIAFKNPVVKITWPRSSQFEYFSEAELREYLTLDSKKQTKKFIDSKIGTTPKGQKRSIIIELMYSATKFSKKIKFNLKQTGALLSLFYFTHIFFLSNQDMNAEKIYIFFKEFLLRYSLPCPPQSVNLFNHNQAREIMLYFCKIYLRNLPILRLLCLPNFCLYLDYQVDPEPPLLRKRKDKAKSSDDKKGKKGKKDKDKPKGGKGKGKGKKK